MNRCGGCREPLEAVMGDTIVWLCPNTDCSYEGPTLRELFARAVQDFVSQQGEQPMETSGDGKG